MGRKREARVREVAEKRGITLRSAGLHEGIEGGREGRREGGTPRRSSLGGATDNEEGLPGEQG